MIPAGEFGRGLLVPSDAEGATAPETLRPLDRAGADTLESGGAFGRRPPTE